MLVNKMFNHVESPLWAELEAETNPDGTRYYQTPDGKSYPSVTTVTGWEKRAFFAEWRRKKPSSLQVYDADPGRLPIWLEKRCVLAV